MKWGNKLSWGNSVDVLPESQVLLSCHPSFLRNSRCQPTTSEQARKFPWIQDSIHNFL